MVGEADESQPLLELHAGRAERVHAETNGDRAVVTDRFAHDLECLEPEARPVLERASVLVRALVVEGRKELKRQVAVAAVDVDDVEAGVAPAFAARTQSACTRRMSSGSIVFGTMCV